MLKFIFELLCLFATPNEIEIAKYHYSHVRITNRIYVKRIYIDTTYSGSNKLISLHEEGWDLGLGYQRILYFGLIDKSFHIFMINHNN